VGSNVQTEFGLRAIAVVCSAGVDLQGLNSRARSR